MHSNDISLRRLAPLAALAAVLFCGRAGAVPAGLLFHASFDKLTANADYAAGDGTSTLTAGFALG